MAWLEQQNAAAPVEPASDPDAIEDVHLMIDQLTEDKSQIDAIIPRLPAAVQEFLGSEQFWSECDSRFIALDTNGDGRLSPQELAPLVADLASAFPCDVTEAHMLRFADIFDADGSGHIEQGEWLYT